MAGGRVGLDGGVFAAAGRSLGLEMISVQLLTLGQVSFSPLTKAK